MKASPVDMSPAAVERRLRRLAGLYRLARSLKTARVLGPIEGTRGDPGPRVVVNPSLTPEQLLGFYERNAICEAGLRQEGAARILEHPQLIIAALEGDDLVGLVRATFDGNSAHIMEFSLDLRWQGETKHANGSLIEADPKRLGRSLGAQLLAELEGRGCSFVSGHVVNNCEERFYQSLGFRENEGHTVFVIDKRTYAHK